MNKLFSNFTFWVLLAISMGALLGYIAPLSAVQMQPLGDYFIQLIKVFIGPIIFLTISLGISGMGNLQKVGRVGGKALLYFEIVTSFALLIGILVAWIIKPGKGVHIIAVRNAEIAKYTNNAMHFSWMNFFKSNLIIQVVLLSIVFGIFLSLYKDSARIVTRLSVASNYVFKALHKVMYLAPVGAFGGMAFTIGKYGIAALLPLGKLMLTVYTTMALFIFIALGLILRYYQISLWQFLKYIKAELLIVFGTSSSEAALPSLIEKLEKMGCHKSVVGLVVPAGYSFNLDGTTIYLSMSIIFLAQVYSIQLNINQIWTIIGILLITSKGAAGVTGSGFIVLASTLAVVKVIPIEGLALLLGIDRFMSEARSITNFIGNSVATIFIANHENQFDRVKMNEAFTNETLALAIKNKF